MGIGFEPAVIALAVYCLQLIIRNAVIGLRGVSGPVQEAARGMGLTRRQTLMRVELPLALPAIFAGIRLAAVSTVGIATIAVYIGAGGLGVLIVNDGIQRGLFVTPIFVGAVDRHGHGDRHRPRAGRARAGPDALAARPRGGRLMGDIWDAFQANDGWGQTVHHDPALARGARAGDRDRADPRRHLRQGRPRRGVPGHHGLEPRAHRARPSR